MLHNLSFQTLPADLRDYIGDRFRAHGLDPAEAYEKLIPGKRLRLVLPLELSLE